MQRTPSATMGISIARKIAPGETYSPIRKVDRFEWTAETFLYVS